MSLKFMLVLDSWISYSKLYERQGCLLTSAKQNGLYIHLRQLFFFREICHFNKCEIEHSTTAKTEL